MRQVRLEYGSDGLIVDLPGSNVKVLNPRFADGVPDELAGFLAAVRAPIQSRPLRETVSSSERVAVVVTTNGGYPLDQNLYRAVKGVSAAAQIVEQGGLIVAASRCNDGFPAHGNFRKLLFEHSSPAAILETISAPGFSMYDQWEAQLPAIIRQKARVGLFSEIPPADVSRAHLDAVFDVGGYVAEELKPIGPDAPVAVLPEGPMTIPYLV